MASEIKPVAWMEAAFREEADRIAEEAWASDYDANRATKRFMADDRVRNFVRSHETVEALRAEIVAARSKAQMESAQHHFAEIDRLKDLRAHDLLKNQGLQAEVARLREALTFTERDVELVQMWIDAKKHSDQLMGFVERMENFRDRVAAASRALSNTPDTTAPNGNDGLQEAEG